MTSVTLEVIVTDSLARVVPSASTTSANRTPPTVAATTGVGRGEKPCRPAS